MKKLGKRAQETIAMLRTYGFTHFAIRNNTHLVAVHPRLETPLWFSGSPEDMNAIKQVERDARRLLGLDNRGRVTVEGERRQKPRKRHVPQQRYGQGEPAQLRTLAEIRAERTYTQINRMMREHL